MFMYIAKRVKRLTLTVLCVSVHPQSQNGKKKNQVYHAFFFNLPLHFQLHVVWLV